MTEHIPPIFDKKVDCSFCNHSFTTSKVRSRYTRPTHTDTDFCTTYKQEQFSPLLYAVTVCPQCGYASTEQFSAVFSPEAKRSIQSKITDEWQPQDYTGERSVGDALKTYKFAILSSTLKQEKAVVIAGLYLRIVWLYRKLGNEEQEKRFMRMAQQFYKKAYEEDNLSQSEMAPLRVLYLVGELNRRLENYREAVRYFSMVIEKKDTAADPKMVEMARDQWHQTREDQKLTQHTVSNMS